MKTFKKRIFVKIEQDQDDSYLCASDDCGDLAEMGEQIKVGIYELVETKTLVCKPELVRKHADTRGV